MNFTGFSSSMPERERRILVRIAELRKDPEACSWGGLRREAEIEIDDEIAAEDQA